MTQDPDVIYGQLGLMGNITKLGIFLIPIIPIMINGKLLIPIIPHCPLIKQVLHLWAHLCNLLGGHIYMYIIFFPPVCLDKNPYLQV